MSASMIMALSGLAAFVASVSGVLIPLEGASTMYKLVNGPEFKAAVLPTTVFYPGDGSGAGKSWVLTGDANNQVMGFGDGSFVNRGQTQPLSISEVPIAFNAITLYANLPGIPAAKGISYPNQCGLFNAPTRGRYPKWGNLIAGLPPALAAVPVTVVVRSDSSGSTNAIKLYLSLVCARLYPTFTFAVNTNCILPNGQLCIAAGYVGGDTTSGVVAKIQSIKGAVGYAACDQTPSTTLREIPLQNLLGTYTLCRNCPSNPTAIPGTAIKCGSYAAFAVATPPNKCDWTGIQVNGDKDNDGDIYGVDTDVDGDGIKVNDFPIVFAEFAYFNNKNRTPTCAIAKVILKKMISSKFLPIYPKYGFVPLPLNMRRTGCACIKTLCGGVPTTSTGVLTAAGDCL